MMSQNGYLSNLLIFGVVGHELLCDGHQEQVKIKDSKPERLLTFKVL